MSRENAELVRRVEEAWDAGKLDALDELFAPSFVSHTAMPGAPPGLETAKEFHRAMLAGLPDRRVEIQDLLTDGDRVAVRCRVTGTNTGGLPIFGVPANGNAIDVEFIGIYRIQDGKVAEHWAVNDGLAVLQQLGAIPTS